MQNETNESDTMVAEPEQDSPDDIQQQIEALQTKLKQVNLEEDGPNPTIELPIADVLLKIERGTVIPKHALTPPEVMLLVAMHHRGAGEMPVLKLELAPQIRAGLRAKAEKETNVDRKKQLETLAETLPDKVKVDPRAFRNALAGKYGAERVNKLFPGAEPVLPTTFRRALNLGLENPIEGEGLFKMQAFGG